MTTQGGGETDGATRGALPSYMLGVMDLESETDVVLARGLARRAAAELGFAASDQTCIATAVSEIARNAYMYARDGWVELLLEDAGAAQMLVIYVRDSGPGITNLDDVLAGRFTSNTGYGLGLAGAGRLMDVLDVESTAVSGTVVRLGKWLPAGRRFSPAQREEVAARIAQAPARSPLEELSRQNRELMRTVQELTVASTELAAANRELDAFAYSVSHDLHAPLRSIRGFSQALLEDYADRLDETGKDYLRRVHAATGRMGQLIDEILKLSRISRADQHKECLNLSVLARSIARTLSEQQPDRQIEFAIQEGLHVKGDAALLGIAVENLLGNAVKYTRHKPVARIAFGAEVSEGVRTFFVRDNGAGFDSSCADQLFQAFGRLHPSAEFEGTGIGLTTVQRIIQRHGGRIWAQGVVGEGATFYFTL
jgi:signal transduction histidine kinase